VRQAINLAVPGEFPRIRALKLSEKWLEQSLELIVLRLCFATELQLCCSTTRYDARLRRWRFSTFRLLATLLVLGAKV
jgi:hypothetical protein